MKIIEEIKIVGATSTGKLEELILETTNIFQKKGYVVEIQFSINDGQCVALIIGRWE